jgi:ribonuclease HI
VFERYEDVELREFLGSIDGEVVSVYTDGACSGNPGPGGWAGVFVNGGKRASISGSDKQTTNNRMEMKAAVESLKIIPGSIPLALYTDSSYLKNGATIWIQGWKARGWKSSSGGAVKNQDLWMELEKLLEHRNVTWFFVKGHANCTHNNMADSIAKSAIVSLYINDL